MHRVRLALGVYFELVLGDYNPGWARYVHFTNAPVPAKLKNKTENHHKKTTIMASRPTILHRRLYFSAYTPPPLAINGMMDSPIIVRRYGVGGLAGYAWGKLGSYAIYFMVHVMSHPHHMHHKHRLIDTLN